MNTNNHAQGSTDVTPPMDNWVLESSFLDLLADEEKPDDLDDWALQRGWSSIVARARDRVEKISRNAEGNWWPSTEWRSLPKFNDASETAEWFLDMKASRVKASLQCNESSLDYACSTGDYASDTKEEKRLSVRREQDVYGKTLDAILLDSLAAFATVQREAPPPMSQELVLSALIHSEICASGTTADVSYGMARAFKKIFKKDDSQWYWLFHLISTHNQARGWSHQRNYVECIRLLEPQLVDFESKLAEEDKKYLPLAERLTFFPAIFTLSDALHDCKRDTEAAWWLRSALRKQPRKYWESRLNIELSILDDEREATPPVVNTKPKLMNKTQQVEFIKKERLISECQQKHFDYLDYTSKWAEALTWTIRWHEGDPVNLPVTIKRAALSIYTVSEAFKVHLDKNDKTDFNLCFNKVSQVLGKLREAIQCNAADKGIVFQFLSPKNDFIDIDRPFKLRESIDIWDAIKELLPALASMRDFQKLMGEKKLTQVAEGDKSDLKNWEEKLRQRLRKGWKYRHFADIAADQQVFDILGNESMLCSHNKRGRPDCIYDKTNCAAETLLLGDPKSDSNMASTKTLQIEDTDRKSDIPVASTDYLLTRMSRTDSEFTRFLEVGSLERRADDSKVPITPWTEFISLRRWNSFSPNLASRATTTVGGGYLVRVWNNEFGKYVGIAIDPGYNYLENLFDEGFTLPDLDVIVITHAHPDHVENLSNILTLLRERKSRLKKIRRVFLVLTEGVFQRFKTLFDNEVEFIEDVVVLSWAAAAQSNRNTVNVVPRLSAQVDERPICLRMGKKEEVSSSLVSIRAVPAIHADGTQYDSMGVVLRVTRQGDGDLCIGFTGDTRYTEELCIKDSFDDCDVLIPHIGSVIGRDSFSKLHEMWRLCDHKKRVDKVVDELQDTMRKKNHLYLPGITMFLCKLKESMKKEKRKPLILLSEFGEELRGGLRADLAVRLRRISGMTVLPADVGLRVGVEDQSVRCAVCRQYVSADAVRPVPASDEDEALMFICIHCYNARKHELPILLSRLRNTPHEYHPANQSESHRG